MRKALIVAAGFAVVAMPFVAQAAGAPVFVNTALLQSADQGPATIPVKKHRNFLPFIGGAALLAGGITAAATSGNGNSPS